MFSTKNPLYAAAGTAFAAIAFTLIFGVLSAQAQQVPLPLGNVNPRTIKHMQACPAAYYPGMSCFSGMVQDCANASDIGFSYGVINPRGEVKGTIVFLEGGGGTSAYQDPSYPAKYIEDGFQLVYVTWDSDWEATSGSGGTSIKDAACRPATFLNYIYDNLYNQGGICVQALSAGAGAAAYSLAWYGSSSYLDNVELLSGPVFGNIEQGCVVPHAPTVTVCPTGQFGCNGEQWPDPPDYVNADPGLVGHWSGQPSCNAGNVTGQGANAAWEAMSIIDGNDEPSFFYPQTSLAGWLCSNVDSEQNNSAAQAQFFFQQFTGSGQTAAYSVTRIDHCNGPEDVSTGITPQGLNGFDAVTEHMVSACFKRHFRHTP
ncbi:MAG TPA: hypothetical protein VNY51_11125 [Candidatus Dormibacteraeota bacterium]|nr:hypothetical protein [Candidatus Dormibacteraeota bacterium]